MRIAVIGASGFIGRALVPALVARKHEVRAIGRDILGDVATFTRWGEVVSGSEAVVHLAGLAHQRGVSDARLRAVNVDAPVALGKAAAIAGAHMLFMSSVKALGEETTNVPFNETSPYAPRDSYGEAKAAAERALFELGGLDLTVLRPPLVYGPGVKANFFALLRVIQGGWPLPLGSVVNRRSLIYVGNLVDAIICCLETPKAKGRTYCVANGSAISTPDLIRSIAQALGRPARLLPFPVRVLELVGALVGRGNTVRRLTRSLEVDDSAIRRELGWHPPSTFEDGVHTTARWFCGHCENQGS